MPDVMAFLAGNQLINAIKLLRERLGCGLKDAKDVAEAVALAPSGPTTPWAPPSEPSSSSASSASSSASSEPSEPPLERMRKNDEVMALVRRADQKINAIKRVRELTGLGLKDSMDLVTTLAAAADPDEE